MSRLSSPRTKRITELVNPRIWVDFKSPDMPLLCHDFAVEVPEAGPATQWGCGIAGSCGRSFREIPAGGSITRRQLINAEFTFNKPGTYTLHARTVIAVHNQDVFDSPEAERLEVSDTLKADLQSSNESQLRMAFRPYVEELNGPEPEARSEVGRRPRQGARTRSRAPAFGRGRRGQD